MQISSKLFNQQQLKQFSSSTEELQDLQNKIASGENILRASDDPVGMFNGWLWFKGSMYSFK